MGNLVKRPQVQAEAGETVLGRGWEHRTLQNSYPSHCKYCFSTLMNYIAGEGYRSWKEKLTSLWYGMWRKQLQGRRLSNRQKRADRNRQDMERRKGKEVSVRLQEDRLLGMILQEHEEEKQVRRTGKFLKKDVTGWSRVTGIEAWAKPTARRVYSDPFLLADWDFTNTWELPGVLRQPYHAIKCCEVRSKCRIMLGYSAIRPGWPASQGKEQSYFGTYHCIN